MNKKVSIVCIKNEIVISNQCVVAQSYFSRLKGLLGVKKFDQGQGLWLKPCNNIHMWFMRIPIDVIFLKQNKKSEYQVTSVHKNKKPWSFFPIFDLKATSTLELPVGTIHHAQVKKGDALCIS